MFFSSAEVWNLFQTNFQDFRAAHSSQQCPPMCKERHQKSFTHCLTMCSREKCNCFAMQCFPPEMFPFLRSVNSCYIAIQVPWHGCHCSRELWCFSEMMLSISLIFFMWEKRQRKLTQNLTVLKKTSDEKDTGRAKHGTMQYLWQNRLAHLCKRHETV